MTKREVERNPHPIVQEHAAYLNELADLGEMVLKLKLDEDLREVLMRFWATQAKLYRLLAAGSIRGPEPERSDSIG